MELSREDVEDDHADQGQDQPAADPADDVRQPVDEARSAQFRHGSFATIYLSPRDYHRVHMPLAGTLTAESYIPGDLYSVNQVTAENVPRLFSRNERLVCYFDTAAGPVAMVLVGAMIVAGIETVWAGRVAPPPVGPWRPRRRGPWRARPEPTPTF